MSALTTQQKLVRVNAKYRSSGTTRAFRASFASRELDAVRGISLLRATLSRTFPNIYSPINIFSYQENMGPVVYVAIPPAQYTATTLGTAIGVATGGIVTSIFNTSLDRFQFAYNGGAGSAIILSVGSISNYIGLTTDLLMPNVLLVYDAQSVPQLQGPTSAYLESENLAGSHCVDAPVNGSYIPFLGCIDFTAVPYGFEGSFVAQTPREYQVDFRRNSGSRSLNSFDISVTDQYGNPLQIPDSAFLDMTLVFTY